MAAFSLCALAVACKADADKYCNDENLYPEPGAVITCLREVKDKLDEACKAEIFETQLEAAVDMATDVMLSEMCQADADSLCADVKPGEGRVQECLVRCCMPLKYLQCTVFTRHRSAIFSQLSV